MAKILIIHGAGMNMRGKVQTEIFGPMTLPQYDDRIRGKIPDDRGPYLEPSPPRPDVRDSARQPGHGHWLRPARILSGATRSQRHAGGKEIIRCYRTSLGWRKSDQAMVKGCLKRMVHT